MTIVSFVVMGGPNLKKCDISYRDNIFSFKQVSNSSISTMGMHVLPPKFYMYLYSWPSSVQH